MNSLDGERQGGRASAQECGRWQVMNRSPKASVLTPRMFSVMVWAACLFLLSSATPLAAQDNATHDALTAEQILQSMAQTYANCRSYYDSGMVKMIFFMADGERTSEKPFTTAFVRPDRFRFEYTEQLADGRESRYIVWQSGPLVQIWWSIESDEFLDALDSSLASALAGGTGISGGSAHTVPALLLPDEIRGWRLMDMTEARRIEDAKLDEGGCEVTVSSGQGDDCYRIQGQHADSPIILWIEKKTFLVRRIDREHQFEDFRTEMTTTYSPVIDGEITEGMLEFGAPDEE